MTHARQEESTSLVSAIAGAMCFYAVIARDDEGTIFPFLLAVGMIAFFAVKIFAFFSVGRWWELAADFRQTQDYIKE